MTSELPTTLPVAGSAPLVSVVMTARNAAGTIGDAIASLKAQSLDSWELVLVDDGSTDETVRRVLDHDMDNVLCIDSGPIGRGHALNLAVAHARGELIANLDADDLAHPQRLEVQARFLRAHPEVALVGGALELFTDSHVPRWDRLALDPDYELVGSELLLRNSISHSSMMIRAAELERLGGYDQTRHSLFDYELWLRMLAMGLTMARLDTRVGGKRIHDRQSFENRRRIRYLVDRFRLQREAIRQARVPFHYRLLPAAVLVYGLAPRRLRMRLAGRGSR